MNEDSPQTDEASRSELRESTDELLARAERVVAAQNRLRSLLDATRVVSEELELDRVLARIAQAAVALVDARYGALGVVDDKGMLERFIHVGMDPDVAEAIGHLPEGHGLLGAVIDSRRSIRLPDLREDPRAVGFPNHHPPMKSFLGVPIRVRDEVYGNLYLTDRRGHEFSEEDEDLIESLAAAAGIAIENARLYDEARRQQRLSDVLSEISAALLSPSAGEALGIVTDRLADLVDARLVTIVTPLGADQMRVDAAGGSDAAEFEGAVFPSATSIAAQAIDSGKMVTGMLAESLRKRAGRELGHAAAVPFVAAGRTIGALCVSRGAHDAVFTPSDLTTIAEFAAQAALAVSLAWARRDRQRLEVIEERSRIARDLHDHVIQRLFATGLSLQSIALTEPARADEITQQVAEIDAAITDIRTVIFTLRSPTAGAEPLTRHRVLDVVTELTSSLASAPRIAFTGPVDLTLTGSLAHDVVAVVRESLANVARHARAASTAIAIDVSDGFITITVDDDGDGLSPTARQASGTANLAHRATAYGGAFTLEPRADRGTRAQWRVPIPRE